ncbi:unnamed protein product, partial [Ascophyllum nodosum]
KSNTEREGSYASSIESSNSTLVFVIISQSVQEQLLRTRGVLRQLHRTIEQFTRPYLSQFSPRATQNERGLTPAPSNHRTVHPSVLVTISSTPVVDRRTVHLLVDTIKGGNSSQIPPTYKGAAAMAGRNIVLYGFLLCILCGNRIAAQINRCTSGAFESILDGWCDETNNNEECLYDGGDCCPCSCINGLVHTCGINDFFCRDPNSGCVDPHIDMYPTCTDGNVPDIGDGQ